MKHLVLLLVILIAAAVTPQFCQAQPPGPGGPPRGGEGRGDMGSPLVRLLDADRDGVISGDELGNAAAKLKELDTNQDGKLSADELRGQMRFGPGGPRGGPGAGFGGGGFGGPPASESTPSAPPVPKDDEEKKILDALDVARGGPRYANVSTADGRLLRQLTESIGAKLVVEIGTSTGESGIWFALALRKTGGKLVTHDIDPERIKVARQNFEKAGVGQLITIIEGDAHETVKQHKDPIDVLFLDADKDGYLDYLDKLLPLVRPGGLIIAHNMRRPTPDPRYIEAITKNPDLETSFLLMDGSGVGVTMKKR
jgi:predicted O-methyltransferase YrrM